MISTSEMALIDSVNHGYGTDACLHYTLNDIMLQMTQVYMSWYLLATSPPGLYSSFFSKFTALMGPHFRP